MEKIKFLHESNITYGTIISDIFNDGNDTYYAISCDDEIEYPLTESEVKNEYGVEVHNDSLNNNITIVNTKCVL